MATITDGTLLSTDYTVGGGEVTVADITASVSGIYDFNFDAANLEDGDIINVRVITQALEGGALSAIINTEFQLTDVESAPMITGFPITVGVNRKFQILFEQTAGTARNWDWEVLALTA